MNNIYYWDILDQKRKDLLPFSINLKDDFYLAGETALTLLLGHRDSIDFYPYKIMRPLLETDYFQMASLEDIGCMKLSAITSQSLLKDLYLKI